MSEIANILLVNRAIITNQERVLLVRRADNDPHNGGLWEFPGGKVDAGEENKAGLIREVFEETGLNIEISSSMAHVESELIKKGRYKGKLYVALFYAAQRLGGELNLSSEHSFAQWETPESVTDFELTSESRRAVESMRSAGII